MPNEFDLDKEALLENLSGWVGNILKEELNADDNWRKVAELCIGINNKRIFSSNDILKFKTCSSPADLLLKELMKRCVTTQYLLQILKEAEMNNILNHFKAYEKMAIVKQTSPDSYSLILPGDDVFLEVETKGFPLANYLWFKEETQLDGCTSNSLTIHNFGLEDEGIYLCYVTQSHKDKHVECWSEPFCLFFKPTQPFITVQPSDKKLFENEKISLKCEAKGYPPVTYEWKKNNELIASSQDNSLTIDEAKLTHAGCYVCVVSNSEGQCSSRSVYIQIEPLGSLCEELKIITHPILCENEPERSIGQSFSLVCSARCSKNVIFTWIINGKELNDPNNQQYLIMSSASQPDYSSCLCYTVSHEDGTSVRVLCSVKSTDASCFSKEVCVKINSSNGPIQFQAGTKWALLVANTDYNIDPLPSLFTPSSDMQLIAKQLTAIGYHCLLLTNLNLIEFKNTVKIFSQLIKPGDYVVFCYAGHGLFSTIDQLMPVPDKSVTNEVETLSSVWLRNVLQKNDPALLFVVLDMCRHIYHRNVEMSGEMIKVPAQRNCLVLHATSEGYQSLEDPNTSSVLTSSLVKHLKDDTDVVNMARSVLRDIAHKSSFVRKEQIPKLDINLCENRSLRDPTAFLDSHQERLWASLNELPSEKTIQKCVNGCDITINISCTRGGESNLLSNVMNIHLQVISTKPPPPMSLTHNIKEQIKVLGRFGNKISYELKAVHALKVPLVFSVKFQTDTNDYDEDITLPLPGIAKVKIDEDESPCHILKSVPSTFNIF